MGEPTAALVTETGGDLVETRVALFDPARVYRYRLQRRWGDGPAAVFVMLNPSTATAERDDSTMRRCLAFARRERCGALTVVNLFALRSPDPRTLAKHPDPVGPANDTVLRDTLRSPALVIAAWGTHGALYQRAAEVARLITPTPAHCLGLTADGHPRHPLYLPADTPLTPYRPDSVALSPRAGRRSTAG